MVVNIFYITVKYAIHYKTDTGFLFMQLKTFFVQNDLDLIFPNNQVMMSTRTEKCDANFGSSCMLNPGIYSDSVPYTIRSMTLLLCCAFHKPSSGTISSVSIFVIEPYQ